MTTIDAIRFEFARTRRLGERALDQLPADAWHARPDAEANSVAILVQHLHGNMRSRWSDFGTSDGEKPTRRRDAEFEDAGFDPGRLRTLWDEGWACCEAALVALDDADLARTVTIRGEPLTVLEALLRQQSHYAYHIGQIVQLVRHRCGPAFESLTIPRGKSAEHTRGDYKRRA